MGFKIQDSTVLQPSVGFQVDKDRAKDLAVRLNESSDRHLKKSSRRAEQPPAQEASKQPARESET
ncbi:MAG TPA: hypothetical protein VK447_20895 [Myxococcaceae bacterium]|nr:hypothetical protein [Myxococcaceae bacterium]